MNCPRCGTPMQGGICPECGFPVNRMRKKASGGMLRIRRFKQS